MEERKMMNYKYCNGITHTIKQGDTLYSISRKHKIPLAMILRANPYVDVYNLKVGDTICVPVDNSNGMGVPEENRRNDNVIMLDNMMERNDGEADRDYDYNDKVIDDQKNNMADDEMDGMMREAMDSVRANNDNRNQEWVKYVVQPGDTMADIMRMSGNDMAGFWDMNDMKDIYILPGIVCHIKE